jgi:hypothetical protein
MTDIIVKIMVEVLNIFAIATKEIKQSRGSVWLPVVLRICANLCSEKFLKLMGKKHRNALERLDAIRASSCVNR